jgi:hypothetical protein
MNFPSKETVEAVRRQYPKGTRVELVQMSDPYSKLSPGDRGRVKFVDDTGTVFVAWDRGSGLGVVYGEDVIKAVRQEVQCLNCDFRFLGVISVDELGAHTNCPECESSFDVDEERGAES